ncbi:MULTISPECIES: DUF2480 family protein [Roseivirga]|uniref:DUF2480 family protein n=1 Tax=Roseivirga TaxID=290180 RepID=UPI001B1F01A0|nr:MULTISPECIES: DUF2480 family protein [Roseivirga]MBO6661851.1 DUF2480 family protein [Roseivirga sp.]MBO6909560.1 DUF2480 family protein [Roseivirga sp.]WPZ08824.1 DUF2480 family protein [Roseivirga spongicola]
MAEEIINRVASSPLVTIDLEDYYHKGEREVYDLAQNLFQGMILREKDLREFVKEHDWSKYEGKNIALTCSEDAIVPTWAYMLVATKLEGVANKVVMGSLETLEYALYQDALRKIDAQEFADKPIVIKGCGNLPVPDLAYVELTMLLKPYAKSIMYGEPCSTVPLYKKPRRMTP